jgi:hypothetical protein
MDFSGKRTERVLMRVSADMKREVAALAELEQRQIQDQYRFLLTFALQHFRSGASNGTTAPKRQPMSTRTFAERKAKQLSATDVDCGQRRTA